jgi:hypothetical protein
MDLPVGLPKLGYTVHGVQLSNPTSPDPTPGSYGTTVAVEGTPYTFRHLARVTSSNGIRPVLSGCERNAVLVRNTSGTTLLPGQVVTWQTGFRGQRVAALAAANNYNVAGVVDYYLPSSGVADKDLFWLFRSGPVEVRFDGNSTSNNGVVISTTAGKEGSAKDKAGSFAGGTDIGFALESKTTSTADPWVKVDLRILF